MVAAFGRTATVAVAFCATVLHLAGCSGGNENPAIGGNEPANPTPPRGWELVWSDEFSGSELDLGKWNIQLGDGTEYGIPGWGNNELQTYQAANVTVSGGNLVITAREQQVGAHSYTSARINTANKMDMRYGRVEASIRTPAGQGLWAAFWMLPTDSVYGSWAASGEIDILEVYSRDPSPFVLGTVHYGMRWPLNLYTGGRYSEVDPADGFHTYALEWDQNRLRWFVDGTHFLTVGNSAYWTYYRDPETNAYTAGAGNAPFDQNFHLLLNLAVGGNLPGPPVASSFPGELLVDYVRVYRCNIETPGVDCAGFTDLVDPSIVPAPSSDVYIASYDLYTDAVGPLGFPNSEATVPLEMGVYDNNGALGVSEVDGGEDRGMVIDMNTTGGGNFSIHAAGNARQTLFGMGKANEGGDYAGEVQFDLYVYSEGTDADSNLQVKLDSGFPDLGFVELAMADLPKDEWTTVTVSISDILRNPSNFGGGPLDIENVLSLIVLEPSGAAHLRVDNIKILCGHNQDRGCGILPPAGPAGPRSVFLDEVNPLWDNGIRAWDSAVNADYSDGANPANKVQWQIIDAADAARGKVIEVTFTDGDATGVWFIQSSAGVDLRSYAAGVVSFDIKVDDYGANTEGMTMKIDCMFPCTSGDQPLGKVGDGAWETVQVPVTQLMSSGLDLVNVNTGLVIFPADQSVALTFQLDNIEWLGPQTGGGPLGPLALYEDALAEGWGLWDCCGGATFAEVDAEVDAADHGKVIELTFGATPTVVGLQAASAVDASRYREGTLEFDFRQVAPPQEGAVWRLKVESEGAATAVDIPMTNGGNPEPSAEWQTYRFGLSTDLAGLDLARFTLALFFPDWGQADGAVGRIDNVRLVPPPVLEIALYEDELSANWFLWDCCGAATFGEVDDDEEHGKVIELRYQEGATVTGLQAVEGVDASVLANPALEFEFKEVSPPPEGSQWRLKLESTGAATAVEVLMTAAGNPAPSDVWQSYRFDLTTDLVGLDVTDLNLVLVFPDWGNAAGAVARMDNVRLVATP